MQMITTWIKRLSRARDIQTAKSLVCAAFTALSHADFVTVLVAGDELTAHSFETTSNLAKKYTDDEFFWLSPNEAIELTQFLPNNSPNQAVLVIPIKDEKLIATIWVSWNNCPKGSEPVVDPLLILAQCFLIVLKNVVVHSQLAKQMAERTSNLSEARQEAEAANQLKSRFLSAASHDLRQPLQQISSLIDVLVRQSKEQLPQTQLKRIQRIISDMNTLLNSLLNLDRLETGSIEPIFKKIQITDIFDTLKSDFALQAAEKNINLVFETSPVTIISDRALLLQILRNLLGNAIKYTHLGEVRVSANQENDFLILAISDTGPGIEQEKQASIFDAFYQLPSQHNNSSGFGIGLALVKALAQTMNHPITLVSEIGKGSVFSIQLPVNNSAVDELNNQDDDIVQFPEQDNCMVLYLEDDDELADSISTLLTMEGYQVITASSSVEAKQVIDEQQKIPDIIVTDNSLDAGESGIEVVQQIRIDAEKYIPAIMLTGYTERTVHQKALKVVQTVLSKPVDADDLLKEIDAIQQDSNQTKPR
ncbi:MULTISPECIES: hybrid sensor histidine kinase/response regulator [unclassified Colwellia]|uniref:ATP-binding response regulator n=1 Tax=unclassified Colwellia TaxID=196834 RepID=UPI0015F56997|nr:MULTISPECIES: hybrid sensor histidine kinase/response regulator [unclassified Colwellia]MBA6356927.1 hybrid sensor histidine kinase/response regulator [Colwellia sp. BRX8-3]MBA6360835.1 hybrid sensor histidine kinase/response regulator [Colwellia sp. BRX8-6]MBA6368958.1 hybrid sensor histidine kinase/response regulator [Colwellia sp. BRX8-5]MBA6374812.1 hybrid sensor histidine kinase/response regulator [Colwellia sp. BRX8-2]